MPAANQNTPMIITLPQGLFNLANTAYCLQWLSRKAGECCCPLSSYDLLYYMTSNAFMRIKTFYRCEWSLIHSHKILHESYQAGTLLPHQRSDRSLFCHVLFHTQSGCTLNQNTAQSLNELEHYLHQNRHQYEL